VDDNRITVTGHAQHRVAPTVAAWHLTIEVTDADARVAYERCAERAAAIVERLKTSAQIETQRVSVEPARDYESGELRQVGHQASTVVTARAPAERAGEIADLAMASGATEILGPQLTIGDRRATELETLEQAVEDARRRADRLAAAAGRALGPVMSIETQDDDYFPGIEELRAGPPRAMPVEVPDVKVQESVTVVFALVD
jgi:uncharacterized protein YggE